MDGLQFQTAVAPVQSDPARADIACFVGFVAPRQRGASMRERLERVLHDLGWTGPALPPSARVVPEDVVPGGDGRHAFHRWLSSELHWTSGPGSVGSGELFARAAAALLGDAVVDWWIENAWLSPFSRRGVADLLELVDVPVPIDTWTGFHRLFAWDERPLIPGQLADTVLGVSVRRFFLQGGRKCYVVRAGDPWLCFAPAGTRVSARDRL